jgi:hypothetical protein
MSNVYPPPLYPALVGGHPRTVTLERERCQGLQRCLAWTGTKFGRRRLCRECAHDLAVLERYQQQRAPR